ncbi:MAG TPA: heavy metal-binding domain-containing protein [Terriglobales bacterium]|nr:heavy metal-binding domain-containing protein [Terriglobales bacterium]
MASYDTTQGVAEARSAEWEKALERNKLPGFVEQRLKDAGAGKVPWISTMSAAELLLGKSHGVRPIATVSGTCWYSYGYSWTEGHAEGWGAALARIRQEALACGANAVVDVQMRTIPSGESASMDFTLLGTAVKIDGLPASSDPVIATVPALEFVRLMEMGVVPCGLAVGAQYEWLSYGAGWSTTAAGSFDNTPLRQLSNFWEKVRRSAHQELRRNAAKQGNGLLAHTHFGELLKQEGGDENQPPRFLGRHIVIGTVIDTRKNAAVPHGIRTVVDMRDAESPLNGRGGNKKNTYRSNELEGGI